MNARRLEEDRFSAQARSWRRGLHAGWPCLLNEGMWRLGGASDGHGCVWSENEHPQLLPAMHGPLHCHRNLTSISILA